MEAGYLSEMRPTKVTDSLLTPVLVVIGLLLVLIFAKKLCLDKGNTVSDCDRAIEKKMKLESRD